VLQIRVSMQSNYGREGYYLRALHCAASLEMVSFCQGHCPSDYSCLNDLGLPTEQQEEPWDRWCCLDMQQEKGKWH
jgi:hypothetical protein